jgi:hypothetical protein
VRIDVTELRPTASDDTAVLPLAEDADEHDDLAAELARAAPRRWWNRGTLVLAAAALLLAGFLGGAAAQKQWGTTANASRNPVGGFAGGNRGTGGGYPGFGGFGGSGSRTGAAPAGSAPAPTTGTVKLVDGTTLYLQTASGAVVIVRTSGRTTVQTASRSALKDLKAGQTVTVQGPAGADGTVTATSVTAAK